MNTPNRLTVLRFVLSALFLALMMIDFPHHYLAALVVFIGASITDWLDGSIARKNNLITDFGKFLDPIADKMLTTAAFLAFTFSNWGYGIVWITFIVLAREYIVASVRMLAAGKGKVIAANMWGKVKTVVQFAAIIFTMLCEYVISLYSAAALALQAIYSVLLWCSAVLTLIAGISYIMQNRSLIDSNK